MRSRHRSRFTSARNRLALAAIITTLATTAEAACPITLAGRLGDAVVHNLRSAATATYVRTYKDSDLSPFPKEVVSTARENIPQMIRSLHLSPDAGSRDIEPITLDYYVGAEYRSASADVFVLPRDERVACTLLPAQVVFLSDDFMNHYALVGNVDYADQTVTLLDAWANIPFKGRGGEPIGAAVTAPDGAPRRVLTFAEFVRLIRGRLSLEKNDVYYAGLQSFDVIASLYPEVAETEDFLFWKYSRIFASADKDSELAGAVELAERQDLEQHPRLKILSGAFSDLFITVRSNFDMVLAPETKSSYRLSSETDAKARRDAFLAVRGAFLDRLDGYAKVFSWPLKWKLVNAAEAGDDAELRVIILDRLIKATPNDIDLQIARARALLRASRPAEAVRQLDEARQQWIDDIASVIDVRPPESAVQFFFAAEHNLLQAYELFYWRLIRIDLLGIIARLEQDSGANVGDQILNMDHDYSRYQINVHDVDDLRFVFFEDVFWMEWTGGDVVAEVHHIREALERANTDKKRERILTALYMHVTSRQSIKDLVSADSELFNTEIVRNRLCTPGALNEPKITPASMQLMRELADFCG